jgi:hypothetical protein
MNYLSGYLNLAGSEVPVSSDDFGLLQLLKSARSRDVEILPLCFAINS